MSRMRKATYAELAERLQRTQRNGHSTTMVLNALVAQDKRARWIRGKQGYSAYVVDPMSPTGGFVGLRWAPQGQAPSMSCYLLEDWLSEVTGPTWGNSPDELSRAVYELAHEVQRWAREVQQRSTGHHTADCVVAYQRTGAICSCTRDGEGA